MGQACQPLPQPAHHRDLSTPPQKTSPAMVLSLQTAVERLEDILESARNNHVTWEDVPGKMFIPGVGVYKDLYDDLAVKTTEEFVVKVSSTADDNVQRLLSKLETLEHDWKKFITTLDIEVKETEKISIAEGDFIDTSVKLVNARTGDHTDLGSLLSSSGSPLLHLVLLRYLS